MLLLAGTEQEASVKSWFLSVVNPVSYPVQFFEQILQHSVEKCRWLVILAGCVYFARRREGWGSKRASRFSHPVMLLRDFLVQFTPLWLLSLHAVWMVKALLITLQNAKRSLQKSLTITQKSLTFNSWRELSNMISISYQPWNIGLNYEIIMVVWWGLSDLIVYNCEPAAIASLFP